MQRRKNDSALGVESGANDGSGEKPKVPKTRSRRRKRVEEENNGWWIFKFSLLCSIAIVAGYFLVEHHEEKLVAKMRQSVIHDELEPMSKEWEEKYVKLEEENEELKRGAKLNANLNAESDRLKEENIRREKDIKNRNKKIEQLENYKAKMQENIQLMSKTALVEK